MAKREQYLYGPVASRRLGLSLGVDVIPFKVCTLDCVYCQLGRTTNKTTVRAGYVPAEVILAELRQRLAEGLRADFITIGGSGEPTLNSHLGEIIDGIKKITNIPVAILTNGTLLYLPDVRKDCAKADVVLPSLDAGDMHTFEKINCPHKDIVIEDLISGLCFFREEFAGQIWLEVFLVEGLNTDSGQIGLIKKAIERIKPDKVHLNTAVRPTAQAGIKKVDIKKMETIAKKLGGNCEVIADFSPHRVGGNVTKQSEEAVGPASASGTSLSFDISPNEDTKKLETLLSMLKRRPCSIDDICSSLNVHRNEALKYIASLQQQGVVESFEKDGVIFFKSIRR